MNLTVRLGTLEETPYFWVRCHAQAGASILPDDISGAISCGKCRHIVLHRLGDICEIKDGILLIERPLKTTWASLSLAGFVIAD